MKKYVIQYKCGPQGTEWVTGAQSFDTLAEAKEAIDKMPFKADHRIAEAYTVTRYKVVKV